MTKRLILLILVSAIAIVFSTQLIAAWDNCPRGVVNDTYPGICNLYVDSNIDSICDYSQENPQTQLNSITQTKETLQPLPAKLTINYNLLSISAILIVIYLSSFILSKTNYITPVFHRRLWNAILMISFLGAGISGILLVLKLSYGINLLSQINMLFWHVETGIVMTLISIFHILWHLPYFKSYFRTK